MGYMSRSNRPYEWASKSQHTHVINDEVVQKLLGKCKLPSNQEAADADIRNFLYEIQNGDTTSIKQIIAVDGGYTETIVRKAYPSSKVAFFQFGALLFKFSDLAELGDKPFIHPDDMAKFKQLERYKLALPAKGISLSSLSMIDTIRHTLIDFFNEIRTTSSFMSTLKWFLFHEYKDKPLDFITLGTSPIENMEVEKGGLKIKREIIQEDGFFNVNGRILNLIDFFRFHEVVNNEFGASGILGYLTNVVEHIIIIHYIRELHLKKPTSISRFLFIKDGPLGFFGQTANLHKDMRELCNYFISKYGLKLVGLEKSGTFVEHAEDISRGEGTPLTPGKIFLLSNRYIYKHILPGPSTEEALNKMPVYASTSYYSGKIIFRSRSKRVLVVGLPIDEFEKIREPKIEYFKYIHEILNVIDRLKCDMYDNALVPVALVNQLVSLANHPSSKLLEKFAIQSIEE